MKKVYLDTCCLNRPFDDQTQLRVRLEAEAVLAILARIENNEWAWIGSEVLLDEVEQIPDSQKLTRVKLLLDFIKENIEVGQKEEKRANDLIEKGFQIFDALHIACAEKANADIFLSTDDNLLKLAKRIEKQLNVRIENPLIWVEEMI